MSAIDEKGSETDATTSVTKPSPMASKKMKIKFVSETTIHNLKREEIYKYIVQLHKRIQRLVKKCRSYKKRVRRLVSSVIYFTRFYFIHSTAIFRNRSHDNKALKKTRLKMVRTNRLTWQKRTRQQQPISLLTSRMPHRRHRTIRVSFMSQHLVCTMIHAQVTITMR